MSHSRRFCRINGDKPETKTVVCACSSQGHVCKLQSNPTTMKEKIALQSKEKPLNNLRLQGHRNTFRVLEMTSKLYHYYFFTVYLLDSSVVD